MNLFITKLISSIAEILVFSIVPFIWWLIKYRKKCSFFEWVGLKKIKDFKAKNIHFAILGVEVAFMVLSVFMLYSVKGIETATSEFAGLGLAAIPAILIYAIFNTSLPEEILFRGFILKRLSAQSGFKSANLMQSILFGIIHGAMFFSLTGPVKAVLITGFTGLIAWAMGYLNEQRADGSILPSWCIHAVANIFSGICSAFLLF